MNKRYRKKKKIPDSELIKIFYDAPMEAFFNDVTIAPVTGRSIKTLQCYRWKKIGIPFRKVLGRVLYQKSDVINWINSFT